MRTNAQLEASRRNGALSSGPKSETGRQISAANSRTHGIFATELILPGENADEFTALLESIRTRHNPQTPEEDDLVLELAITRWRLHRVWKLEAAVLSAPADTQEHVEAQLRGIGKVSRYESRLDRTYEKTETRLTEIQEARLQEAPQILQPPEQPAVHTAPKPVLQNEPGTLSTTTTEPAQTLNPEQRHTSPEPCSATTPCITRHRGAPSMRKARVENKEAEARRAKSGPADTHTRASDNEALAGRRRAKARLSSRVRNPPVRGALRLGTAPPEILRNMAAGRTDRIRPRE